jgi:hypothetical protein
MRKLTTFVLLAAGLSLAAPAMADFRAGVRVGSQGTGAFVRIGNPGIVRPIYPPKDGWHPRPPLKGAHHRRWRRHDYPWLRSYRVRNYEDPLALPPVAPAPPPEPRVVEAAPAEPAPPPDPRGAAIQRARGASLAAPFTIGEALPQDLPHVTLDWRRFELPEPPPGRIYARIGRDVLLITAEGRVVEDILPPG